MRVTFAYPYTATDGTKYLAEESAELDRGLAASLIHDGLARKATVPTPVAEPQDPLPEVPEEDTTDTEMESYL